MTPMRTPFPLLFAAGLCLLASACGSRSPKTSTIITAETTTCIQ